MAAFGFAAEVRKGHGSKVTPRQPLPPPAAHRPRTFRAHGHTMETRQRQCLDGTTQGRVNRGGGARGMGCSPSRARSERNAYQGSVCCFLRTRRDSGPPPLCWPRGPEWVVVSNGGWALLLREPCVNGLLTRRPVPDTVKLTFLPTWRTLFCIIMTSKMG